MELSSVPLCKFSVSRPLSCTMKLDIIPWCLLINSLGYDIQIVDTASNATCSVPSNGIATPMSIQREFTIQLRSVAGEWIPMQPIALTDERQSQRQNILFLPEEGSVIVAQLVDNQLIKWCLTSTKENSTRIITIASYYVVCNLSKYDLSFHAVCINRSDKVSHADVERWVRERSRAKPIPDNRNATSVFKGCDCSMFMDVTQKSFKSTNATKDFNFYLIVSHANGYLAAPILLNKPIIRTSLGLCLPDQHVSVDCAAARAQNRNNLCIFLVFRRCRSLWRSA